MTIRIMNIMDYEQAYALWENTPGMGLNNLDDTRESIERYLERNPNTCFVAEKKARIVGIILCGHDGRRGFIYHMATAESEQRQGIGAALLKAAMSALEREGIHKVGLAVFADNIKGNSFWEKQGFHVRKDILYRNKEITKLVYAARGEEIER